MTSDANLRDDLNALRTEDEPASVVSSDFIQNEEERLDALADGLGTAAASSLGQGGFGGVDEHSGTFNYSIPIYVPEPLNGGPVAKLSLDYNSNGSAQPSLVAAGWRLELGRIEREGRFSGTTDFRNNQGAGSCNDHFTLKLNGKRYTLVGLRGEADVFRIKVEESYVSVQRFLDLEPDPSSGEPMIARWEVTLADGTVYRFGIPAGASDPVRNKVWHLLEVENTYGARLLYEYASFAEQENPAWRELALMYPTRILSGGDGSAEGHDAEVRFVYADEDPPDDEEGYYNLGIDFTGRPLASGDGLTAIIWKRLLRVDSLFRDGKGAMVLARRVAVTASFDDRSGLYRVDRVSEQPFKDGVLDRGSLQPDHRFEYLPAQDQRNPALMARAVSPMGKAEVLEYEPAVRVDKGTPQGLDAVMLVTRYTEEAGSERWTKSYSYYDGLFYQAFGEYRGHARVDVLDLETGMRTENHFERNGIHHGKKRLGIRYDREGHKMEEMRFDWRAVDYGGGRYLPFQAEQVTVLFDELGERVLSTTVSRIADRGERVQSHGFAVDRFGNVLEQWEETYAGERKAENLVRFSKVVYRYRNIDRADRRLIGQMMEKKAFAGPDEANLSLIEWEENAYDDHGKIVQALIHFDRVDAGKVFRATSKYDPRTGKLLRSEKHADGKIILDKETVYHEDPPFRFLPRLERNGMGHETRYETYDLQCRYPTEKVSANGIRQRLRYDGFCRVLEETVISELSRAAKRAAPESVTYSYIISDEERSIRTTNTVTGGFELEIQDPMGRPVKRIVGGFEGRPLVEEETIYDHQTKEPGTIFEPYYQDQGRGGKTIRRFEDPRLRISHEEWPGNQIKRYEYNGFLTRHLEEVRAPNGEPLYTSLVEESITDARGRTLMRAEGHAGTGERYELHYQYDNDDRIIAIRDNLNQKPLRENRFGNRLDEKPESMKDISLGEIELTYDGFGRVIQTLHKNGKGRLSKLDYDDLDRRILEDHLNRETGNRRIIRRVYDEDVTGKLSRASVTESGEHGTYTFSETFRYDDFCDPTETERRWRIQWPALGLEQNLNLTTGYRHNNLKSGRLEALHYPQHQGLGGHIAQLIYDDPSGYPVGITLDGKPVWRAVGPKITARGQVARYQLGNNLTTDITLNPENGLANGVTVRNKAGQILQSGETERDSSGNILKRRLTVTLPNGAEMVHQGVYTQDQKHQLKEAVENGVSRTYTYRADGSRLEVAGPEGKTLYHYDESQPYRVGALSGAETRGLSFDDAGNLIRQQYPENLEQTMTWNAVNQCEQVHLQRAGKTLDHRFYGYGTEDQRAFAWDAVSGTLTLYLGGEADLSLVPATGEQTMRCHVDVGSRRVLTVTSRPGQAPEWEYVHRDYLGSVAMTSDVEGVVTAGSSYDPFGAVHERVGNYSQDIGFCGHRTELDGSEGAELVDFGARFYDPGLGIFLSPDKNDDLENLGFGLNRYAYVRNNPLKHVDENGFGFFDKVLDFTIGALEAAAEPVHLVADAVGSAAYGVGILDEPPEFKSMTAKAAANDVINGDSPGTAALKTAGRLGVSMTPVGQVLAVKGAAEAAYEGDFRNLGRNLGFRSVKNTVRLRAGGKKYGSSNAKGKVTVYHKPAGTKPLAKAHVAMALRTKKGTKKYEQGIINKSGTPKNQTMNTLKDVSPNSVPKGSGTKPLRVTKSTREGVINRALDGAKGKTNVPTGKSYNPITNSCWSVVGRMFMDIFPPLPGYVAPDLVKEDD